jgi:DNA-binding MarR family transcriptional regulator
MHVKGLPKSNLPSQALSEQIVPQSLRESLGFLLNRAGTAVGNAFSQELKMSDMTLAMWRVLAALHDTGHQSLSGLSDFTSVEISTLSRQVATLAGRGLVLNRPSGKNWRSVDISLTPAGHAVVQRLRPATERHESAALDGVDPEDVKELKQLLEKIYRNLSSLDTVCPVLADEESLSGAPRPLDQTL